VWVLVSLHVCVLERILNLRYKIVLERTGGKWGEIGGFVHVHVPFEHIKEKGMAGMSVEAAGEAAGEMTAYKHLAWEEETRLETSGSGMYHRLDALVGHVQREGKEQEKYGQCFAQALATANAIRDELLDQKKRRYVYAPKRYLTARANVDEGMRLLDGVPGLERMKACGKECQEKMDVYAEVWRKIREFDKDNIKPYIQRTLFGRHAFSNEKKASMEEMLRELHVLSVGDI